MTRPSKISEILHQTVLLGRGLSLLGGRPIKPSVYTYLCIKLRNLGGIIRYGEFGLQRWLYGGGGRH